MNDCLNITFNALHIKEGEVTEMCQPDFMSLTAGPSILGQTTDACDHQMVVSLFYFAKETYMSNTVLMEK